MDEVGLSYAVRPEYLGGRFGIGPAAEASRNRQNAATPILVDRSCPDLWASPKHRTPRHRRTDRPEVVEVPYSVLLSGRASDRRDPSCALPGTVGRRADADLCGHLCLATARLLAPLSGPLLSSLALLRREMCLPFHRTPPAHRHESKVYEQWITPGTLEAMKPGRMQAHGSTEEVPG